jgi:hypothetical protein
MNPDVVEGYELFGVKEQLDQKRNVKTPFKTRTLHLSEPCNSRSSTIHTVMQPSRNDKN